MRTGYHLHHVLGLGMDEVAAALGVSVATAKRAMSRPPRRLSLLATHDTRLHIVLTRGV